MTRGAAIAKGRENAALKRNIQELTAMNEEQARSIAGALADLEKAREELADLQENVKFWKDRWNEVNEGAKQWGKDRQAAEQDRDRWRTQAEADRENLRRVEAERERERGYIEGLLDRQYPERPRLPWEPTYGQSLTVGDVSMSEWGRSTGVYGG